MSNASKVATAPLVQLFTNFACETLKYSQSWDSTSLPIGPEVRKGVFKTASTYLELSGVSE
jgi:hypothetical protein